MKSHPSPSELSIPFIIEKTNNRTSRAHLDGDTVVIRLARGMRTSEEERHIDVLLRRMAKVQTKLAGTPVIDPFRPLLQGQTSLTVNVHGHELMFEIRPGTRTRAKLHDNVWKIEKSAKIKEAPFHRFLWKLLSIAELPWVETIVHEINAETLRVPIQKVGLRLTRSRWGSCSHNGSINLSAALLLLPEPELRYVIVHELAHIVHPNHSKRFWQTVESVIPEYRESLKKLKHMRLPRL